MNGWRSQVLTAVLALLALSLGVALQRRLPDPASIRQAPFVRQVTRGASVNLRTGQVTVLDLNASPTLVRDPDRASSKLGTFLVLTLEFVARQQPGTWANLTLETSDGRTFGGLPPLGSDGCGVSQPGIPIRCQVVFEVDPQVLEGAKLRVPPDNRSLGSGDDVALIDLRIDADLARQLRGRKAEIDVSALPMVPARGER